MPAIASGIWVCIDAPAIELIAMQLSVKSMTWHLQTDHYGLDHASNDPIRRNWQSSYEWYAWQREAIHLV